MKQRDLIRKLEEAGYRRGCVTTEGIPSTESRDAGTYRSHVTGKSMK